MMDDDGKDEYRARSQVKHRHERDVCQGLAKRRPEKWPGQSRTRVTSDTVKDNLVWAAVADYRWMRTQLSEVNLVTAGGFPWMNEQALLVLRADPDRLRML